MDREKVIKALEFCADQRVVDTCYGECPYAVADDEYKCLQMKLDALALLKEQGEREKRICKSICDFIRGACSTDTNDDKDFVCHEIQKYFTEGR